MYPVMMSYNGSVGMGSEAVILAVNQAEMVNLTEMMI